MTADQGASERQSGWIIETAVGTYWNGRYVSSDGFVHDINDAVRFARFEDGERIIHWLMRKSGDFSFALRTAEHVWIGNEPQ